jgi:hypothetical protein
MEPSGDFGWPRALLLPELTRTLYPFCTLRRGFVRRRRGTQSGRVACGLDRGDELFGTPLELVQPALDPGRALVVSRHECAADSAPSSDLVDARVREYQIKTTAAKDCWGG